jgi:hypothetical protein
MDLTARRTAAGRRPGRLEFKGLVQHLEWRWL